MDPMWHTIAERIVQGLGVEPGELIDLRDNAGCQEALLETALAIERAGATPLVQVMSADYLERLWAEAPVEHLAQWDRHRQSWMQEIDRVVVLAGAHPNFEAAANQGRDAWQQAQDRLTEIEEARRLPYLLVALPTSQGAKQLGVELAEMESLLLPALEASPAAIRQEIDRVLEIAQGGRELAIHSGRGHMLYLAHGDRPWLSDDGCIDADDRRRGAIVSNMPAGSIYTTVLEGQTRGSLWLEKAGPASQVVFTFEAGRIVSIEAAHGAEQLARQLDSHRGEPRRVSHLGMGLNPRLSHPIGWTLVDEHVHGALFLALGENRYMGGQNESSLNIDYALPGAVLSVDGRAIK
jgi:leucyl aminopeptidase (aminopeptidase T)